MTGWSCSRGLRNEEGFTLVEAMVSLLLAGMVMLLAHEALKAGGRLAVFLTQEMRWSTEMQKAERVLRSTIRQAYPAILSDNRLGYHLSFEGSGNSLEFSALSLPLADSPGLFRIRLEVRDTSLYLRWRQERGTDDVLSGEIGWNEEILLTSVSEVRLRYWDAASYPERPVIKDSWPAQKEFPYLIEMRVHTEYRTAAAPVVLRFSPRIDIDGACRYDVVTSGCRGRS